jgi:hypothetical protein
MSTTDTRLPPTGSSLPEHPIGQEKPVQTRRATVSQLRRGDQFQPAAPGFTEWVTVIKAQSRWSGEVEVWVDRDTAILLPGDLDIWIRR